MDSCDTTLGPCDAPPVDVGAPSDADTLTLGVEAPATATAPTATVGTPAPGAAVTHGYPSLYDTVPTTIVAIVLGMIIVGSVQMGVARIFRLYREEHRALTAFATSMVALVVGIYVCDMLIAGPTAELLSDGERASILGFIKDTALMVFAYYFGTKAQVPTDEPHE
jgi:hypothetical protein